MTKPTVLISGAGIGIGKGMAEAFAGEGYRVVVTDVLDEEGHAVAAAIEAQGGEAQFHHMDVTRTDQVNEVIATVEKAYGPLTTLVCNAGIAKTIPLATMTDDAWDLTLDVDLKGMMRMIRAATPAMREVKTGSIVCLASIVGTALGWDKHMPSAAAKAGVAGVDRSTAIELASDNIRANGIAPGLIRTAQTLDPVHSVGEAGLNAFVPNIPLGRIGTPADIADVAVFLASDKARYLTGQILTVDGGLMVAL